MDIDQVKALLEKYRQGACTRAETKLIEDWLADIKNDDQAAFTDEFIEHQLNLTKGKIDAAIFTAPPLRLKRRFGWMAAAACITLLASSLIVLKAFYGKKQSENQLTIEKHISNGWVYISTPKSINDHIKLPDGSKITLDASSRLRYPVKFVNHKRPIYLDEGEALFEVAKDKASPFTVYTPKFATTALGTAFNIRSYASEHKVSIALIHGKISVVDLHPSVKANYSRILLPHQQIVLNKFSGTFIKSDFKDEAGVIGWTSGTLTFNDATMDEVMNTVENHFNVIVKNNAARTNWSYTGSFKDESLIDVLKTICLTEGISCTINKDIITLN